MNTTLFQNLVSKFRYWAARPLLETLLEKQRLRLQEQVNAAYNEIFVRGEQAGRQAAISELEDQISSRRGIDLEQKDLDLAKKKWMH